MFRNRKLLVKFDRGRREGNPPSKKLDPYLARAHRGYERDVYIAHAQRWATPPERRSAETEEVLYEEFKALWWAFRVLGLFPLKRPAKGKTTFRWFSLEMVYAVCFYVLMGVVVWFEIREKLNLAIKSKDKFDSTMFAILMLMYTVPHLWLPTRYWMGGTKMADLLNDWTVFQAEFRHLTGHPLVMNLRRRCAAVVLSIIAFSYLFAFGEHYALDDGHLKKWEIFYYGYALILLNLHVLLWYLLGSLSTRTSRKMMHYFLKDFSRTGSNLVSRYRLLWLHLSKLTRRFGHVFGYQFGHLALFWFTSLLISIYYLSTISRRPTVIHVGVAANAVTIFVDIMIFCLVAQKATDEVGEVVKEKLQKMYSDDERTQQQLHLFENTVFQNPPVVTLGGYVDVNRQLAVSIFSTTVTYLVVMLQFDMGERTGANTAANGTNLNPHDGRDRR